MTDTSPGQGRERDAAWRARGIAATLGEFDPTQLLDPTKEDDLAYLGKLATDCDEVVRDGRIRWILKPAVRSRVFAEVARDELLQLIEEIRPAEGDELGRQLQDVLRNGQTAVRTTSTGLGLARNVLRFLGPTLGTQAVDREAQRVDLVLSRHDVDQAVQVLLPRRLVGRITELKKLWWYVRATSGVSTEDIFWITGVGGSGKSALLGEFARRLRGEDWSGIPVLQLDFDRPAFYRGTLTTLMMELSRQLELCFPAMQPELSAYRRAARSGASATASLDYSNFEAVQSREHQASSAWQFEMRDHLPIDSKLVLILDTAEEIGLSSEFDLEGLRSWLRQLRTREGLPNLRVVLSGRAFHADQLALVPAEQQLELGDLEHDDAVALLESSLELKGVPGDLPLKELVEMLGGNPLSLKILASHLAEGGDEAARELLDDRSGFDRRFAQAFLYRRILGRLRAEDQDLVKLAHPGLLLRRVTPYLIQHVLAAPCELGNLDESRSRSLFKQLAGQVWLVQRTANPDVVIHRRDLRRLMLQAMTAADNVRALAIHQAAADYYRQGRDPFMTRQEQAVESHYHALFAPDAAVVPDLDLLEAVARTLGEDLDTVPVQARARIKLALGRQLSTAEQQVLSRTDFALYRRARDREEFKLRGVTSPPLLSSDERPVLRDVGDPSEIEFDLQATFERGDLRAVARKASTSVVSFAKSLQRGEVDNVADLTESEVWRAAIASMGRKDFVKALLETLPEVQMEGWGRSAGGRSRSRLTGEDMYRMLFRLHGADCPPHPSSEPSYRSSRLSQTQDLRRFQLIDEPGDALIEVPVRLLRDLATDFVDFFAGSTRGEVISADTQAQADLALLRKWRDGGAPVTLSDLDRLGNSEGSLLATKAADLPRQVKDILVGRMPEIHVLVRVAARKCPPKVLADFAAEAARNPLWPVELGPSQLRKNLDAERERWTSTLITVADRFGLLRRFMDWLEDRSRLKGRPLMLLRTVRDYELRLRQFI
ncbi:ATP-binding protein [Rhizobacter sp. AJA081-3]|uniref:ATP-binding protein n=1 Tax=Rhizobacter sp. AJA081-3 TaxID=2753607 RepID=UPI001AE0E8C0|nr:ATP-binding protein [Rhizobacter sp. AJA081-3]QTN21799.1 ATP-binding protein [Rhizobacter sp. AJA081-3]